MHRGLVCTAGAVLCFITACQRRQKFEVPAHIGRGLPEADSLQALLDWLKDQQSYEADTLRLHELFQLIKVISPQNPDSACILTQQLELLASQSTYPAARGLSALGWASVYESKAQHDSSLHHARQALALLKKAGHPRLTAQALHLLGLGHSNKGNHDSALTYYEQACTIREKIADKRGLADSYNNIGNIYAARGRYAQALEYYQKALALRETIGDKWALAASYDNIGNIHSAQGQYTQALEYHQKALALRETIGDKPGLALSYNNIGNIYISQGRYAQALKYHQKSLQIEEALGNKSGLAYSYNNIGNAYEAQGRYMEALQYYQKAQTLLEALGDQWALTYSYASVGELHCQRGQPHLGRPYLLRALAIGRQLNAYERLRTIYHLLAQTDSALAASGQPAYWKTAYAYARLHTAYNDSVLNEESIRKQAQMESQYEYDKKMALLKAEQEKERAELQRRETERNFSLVITGLTLAGVGVLLYFLRIIQRQKSQLQAVNASLEIANAELKAANQALQESNQVIHQQKQELEAKNEEILDSIRYAERIQRAILPSAERWRKLLPESFVLYLPRDIVAGDFYWLEETQQYIFVGIADATGHGVPGAFVSIVCSNALNRAVRQEGIESPAAILTRAKALVSELLRQEGTHLRDGMDIALVRFDKAHPGRLTYAGANRPLWIIYGDRHVMELSPTRQPVGYTETEKPFEEVEVDVCSRLPVMVYGFTDGVIDQTGGPKGRKLLPKGLQAVLLEVAGLPCAEQQKRLQAFFEAWKGNRRQLDDVTLVGVRVA